MNHFGGDDYDYLSKGKSGSLRLAVPDETARPTSRSPLSHRGSLYTLKSLL